MKPFIASLLAAVLANAAASVYAASAITAKPGFGADTGSTVSSEEEKDKDKDKDGKKDG